jgi:hypothetical protein
MCEGFMSKVKPASPADGFWAKPEGLLPFGPLVHCRRSRYLWLLFEGITTVLKAGKWLMPGHALNHTSWVLAGRLASRVTG